jgi:hypothetical protein
MTQYDAQPTSTKPADGGVAHHHLADAAPCSPMQSSGAPPEMAGETGSTPRR